MCTSIENWLAQFLLLPISIAKYECSSVFLQNVLKSVVFFLTAAVIGLQIAKCFSGSLSKGAKMAMFVVVTISVVHSAKYTQILVEIHVFDAEKARWKWSCGGLRNLSGLR